MHQQHQHHQQECALHPTVCTERAHNAPPALRQVHWSRAARTDKGVHALGNVVALKMLVPPETDLKQAISAHLPKDVTCLDIKRATKSFNAKQARSRAAPRGPPCRAPRGASGERRGHHLERSRAPAPPGCSTRPAAPGCEGLGRAL